MIFLKNNIFLLFILFNLIVVETCRCQTNIYHPFPDSNAIWRVDKYDSSFPNGTAFSTYQIYFDGDTITASGLKYHILSIEGNFDINTPSYGYGKGVFGFLMQDTITRRVYYKTSTDLNSTTLDSLLYDFNLQIGDKVISNQYFRQSGDTMMIYSIDSILINGNYRKKFNISYLDSQLTTVSIIEGIGSTLGGFYQYKYFEQYYDLVCFKQNDTTFYPYSNYSCDPIAASLNDNKFSKQTIDIYPIPAKDYFIISSTYDIAYIDIYDLYGKKIHDFKIINDYNNKILIGSTVPNGIYILFYKINNFPFTELIPINR